MIIFADKINELDIAYLTELYSEDIETARKRCYGKIFEYEGRLRAEQDYYQYLHDVFFAEAGGKIVVFEENGRYISGACFEPYKDGLLLNSLVTIAEARRKGYAQKLLMYALSQFRELPVYAHIHFRNTASRRLHEKVGFTMLYEYAHMLDGAVRSDHITYIRKV